MIILFDENDLVSFGKYLLSEERTQRVKNNLIEGQNLDDKLKDVYHADLANWSALVKKQEQE